MRTDDFSLAPPQGQATALFIGATRYRGARSVLALTLQWWRLVRQMKRMPGYCWHRVYWEPPFTLGTIALFRDRDSLLRFARSRPHRRLMCHLTDHGPRRATAGFIRLYAAEPSGYANGTWRAEGNVLGHEAHFVPLSTQAVGPPVHERAER
jgi:hypothetical protein